MTDRTELRRHVSRKLNILGCEFGRLTVIGEAASRKGHAYWVVQCQCGAPAKEVAAGALLRGKTVSCGCYRRQVMDEGRARKHKGTHGRSHEPEYDTWRGIIRRCTNPSDAYWHRYGGRGITVHPEWLESFDAFIADVGRRPAAGMSIDRIDNDGNYEPGNVRWATPTQQVENSSAYTTGLTRLSRPKLMELVIAERARSASLLDQLDPAEAALARVRELHRESRGSMAALYPNPLCECGKDYPCPTIAAIGGEQS